MQNVDKDAISCNVAIGACGKECQRQKALHLLSERMLQKVVKGLLTCSAAIGAREGRSTASGAAFVEQNLAANT